MKLLFTWVNIITSSTWDKMIRPSLLLLPHIHSGSAWHHIVWSEYKTDLCIGNIRNLDWAEWSVSHVLKDSELLWQNNCQVLDRTSGCACLKDMITCVFRHQAEHLYFIPAPEARLSWALEDEASTIVSAISARHSALYCLALTPVTQLRWTSLPPWQFLEPFTQTHPWVFCDGE